MDTETLVLKIKEFSKEIIEKANEAKEAYYNTDASEENLRAYYLAVNKAYIAAGEKLISEEMKAIDKLFKEDLSEHLTDEQIKALVD